MQCKDFSQAWPELMSTVETSNQETTALPPVSSRRKPSVVVIVALLIVIGIGLARIVSTYHVFNHTIDEGAHLACGIQWFQGSYTYDRKHTPIARIDRKSTRLNSS